MTFRKSYMIKPLWHAFEVVLLRFNHKQGEDKRYADLLNGARVGRLTEEDEALLESRVRHPNHPDIPQDSLVVVCTNAEVNQINNDRLSHLPEKEYFIQAINYTQAKSEVKGFPLP